VIGLGNCVLSDGSFDYAYDGEGNRMSKTDRAKGEVTHYEYDHRSLGCPGRTPGSDRAFCQDEDAEFLDSLALFLWNNLHSVRGHSP
jgi:hypothetical protein